MDKRSLLRNMLFAHVILLGTLAVLLVMKVPDYITILCIAAVSSMILMFLSRSLRKQYTLISQVAEQIALGDHSQRIPSLELDEFDHLGQNLNTMLGKLDNTIHHLAVHREELRLVLSSIDDVLWSQNPDGRLVWANQAFQEMFAAYDAKQRQFYWEVIRDPMLLKHIKDSDNAGEKLLTELQCDGHDYLLSGTKNDAARRRVFILQDIAPIRQATQMKKDFVVNLAHELRTPLTAIKGFTEAMQEKPDQDNSRYLKIINNHTMRLIHLISDLEHLIRLERTSELEKQDIDLNTFFENIRLIISPSIEEKALKLSISLDSRLPRITCDPFKLEQVFINLVENSLRYTTKGEICITSKALDNEILLEFSDTGRGIEANHLPRIFERFYVADPSRNRSQSGTGLGLAIVKHIVLLHHGRIEVQSELGVGTKFLIYLPTAQLSGSW